MSRDDILEVYIGSISGGGFPAQLQEIIFYTNEKKKAFANKLQNISQYYTPDLCMGTSGGNIALYLSISGNWDEGGIHRVINHLNPSMFSQTWWPNQMSFIPTWVLGVFEGSVYRPGYGAARLLDTFNNPSSISNIEMWNTAYNKDQKMTGLFCNKKVGSTYISPLTYSSFEFKTLPLKFLDGNINKISDTIVASASVPLLFKPVVIDNENYVDGGITYPSPLTPLQEEIFNCVKGIVQPYEYEKSLSTFPIPVGTPEEIAQLQTKRNRSILHLTYFSPYDIDTTESKSTSVTGGGIFSTISDSSAVKDRYTAINLLLRVKQPSQNINVVDSKIYSGSLSELLKLHNATHYFCEMYVRENNWIDMAKFTPQEVFDKMNEAKQNIEYLFFYVV